MPPASDEKPARTVGLIGIGLLGSALAERLLAGGYAVIGFDTDPARRQWLDETGGRPVESLDSVATGRRRVILSLPDGDVSQAVVEELQPHLPAGASVVDTTTGDPQQLAGLANQLAEAGVNYLDATIGGSSAQVREAAAVVMVGGDADAVAACGDLFDCFADRTFHVGAAGEGARMKLVVNLVLGLNRAVLAEGLGLAKAFGFDAELALQVLAAGPAQSRVMQTKGPKMITGDFQPQARLAQHLKDVRLILEAGKQASARLPLSELHRTLLEEAVQLGLGDADNSAIAGIF